jgi:cytoskeletal protein CcmA (bactofilin family)
MTDIEAKKVTIAGTLIGNIIASEEVSLIKSGKVLGNITTPKLNVEEGVITRGRVTITAGKTDSLENIIKDSFGDDAEKLFSAMSKPAKQVKQNIDDSPQRQKK